MLRVLLQKRHCVAKTRGTQGANRLLPIENNASHCKKRALSDRYLIGLNVIFHSNPIHSNMNMQIIFQQIKSSFWWVLWQREGRNLGVFVNSTLVSLFFIPSSLHLWKAALQCPLRFGSLNLSLKNRCYAKCMP